VRSGRLVGSENPSGVYSIARFVLIGARSGQALLPDKLLYVLWESRNCMPGTGSTALSRRWSISKTRARSPYVSGAWTSF
jgi:hypothetical protein